MAHENTHHVIGQATPLRFNASMRIIWSAETWQWDVSTVALPLAGIGITGNAPLPAHVNDYEFDGSNLTVTNADFGDAGKYIFQSSALDRNGRRVQWTAYAVIIGKFILYINHMLR